MRQFSLVALGSGSAPTPPPSEDVLAILEEIELTRNTLAEIQALQLEVGGADLIPITPTGQEVSEESLTSQQWLEVRFGRQMGHRDDLKYISFLTDLRSESQEAALRRSSVLSCFPALQWSSTDTCLKTQEINSNH